VDRAPREPRRGPGERPAPAESAPRRLRPIVAIVPLSSYSNGSAFFFFRIREIVSPACSPACSATEPSCGSTVLVLVSVIHAMSPTPATSGGRDGEVGPDRDAVPVLQLDPRGRT
jgi:hypothetical protein